MQSGIGIHVDNLSKRLKKNRALDGITIDFTPNTLHGIIGPDGAGKTTLLRTLIGFLKPDHGVVTFLDEGKLADFARIRPGMAYMPQQQSLYPDLSIAEHLDFFRDLYRIPRDIYVQRREELLRMTQLDTFRHRPAGKLSGGMYKKLGLMCALLQSPNILLLDEPTTGVDPVSRREFWDLLYRFLSQGVLIVVATAYMNEAERCGRVHLLDSGKLLESGEPREVLERESVHNFEEIFLRRAEEKEGFKKSE